MKIFLPFKVKDIGGTSTFARKFQAGMEEAGHQVIFDLEDDYDILFLIVQCPLKYLFHAKKNGKKIVQRLDGTYYWTVSAWKFPLMNLKAMYIRHFFANYTIYQSKYSQDCANHFLGEKRNDQYSIIYNGVDLNLFSDDGERMNLHDSPDQQIFFTATAFRRMDQILPIIDGLKIYRKKYHRNIKLYIAGNFINEVKDYPDKLKGLKFISLLGKVSNTDLPRYERSSDAFLFTHLNPPCPNNVIESIACGLPVCGVADGAMPELIQGETGLLIPAKGTGFWRKRQLDMHLFAANLAQIVERRESYRKKCRSEAEAHYSLSTMINNYIKVFEGTQ